MVSETNTLEAIVVGAGWAGLGVSYYLSQAGLCYRVLERGQIGETWRTQRWDSLNLPNTQTVMPGDQYRGPDSEGALMRVELLCWRISPAATGCRSSATAR